MQEDSIIKNRDWIDSLRVLATLSVIILHVAAGVLNECGNASKYEWWVGNIYDSSVRFCVPIFLMITGALVLSKTYGSVREYLIKRFLRILFPFLFWSIIYIARDLFLKIENGEYLNFSKVLRFLFFNLKNGASFHLWYIYLIIGLYLFFPVIGKWLDKSNKNEIQYFIGIWLITIVAQLPGINKIVPSISITYFSGYIGYPVLGYYLNKYSIDFAEKKRVYVLSILTGIFITIFGTFFITKYQNKFNGFFYGNLTPNVLLVSSGVFLLFKDFVNSNTKLTYIIHFFSKYSYGTYLVHILVLWVLEKFTFSYYAINPVIGIPITSILCFIVSTFVIFGINKLPFGNYISG